MTFFAEVIARLVAVILPWLFNGEKRTSLHRSPGGCPGLDRATLSGIRAPLAGLALVCLAGCMQLGGKATEVEVIMVEPGDTVEIADDREIQIAVPVAGQDKPAIAKKRLAGMVAMPKSVYRELRARAYPDVQPVHGKYTIIQTDCIGSEGR